MNEEKEFALYDMGKVLQKVTYPLRFTCNTQGKYPLKKQYLDALDVQLRWVLILAHAYTGNVPIFAVNKKEDGCKTGDTFIDNLPPRYNPLIIPMGILWELKKEYEKGK